MAVLVFLVDVGLFCFSYFDHAKPLMLGNLYILRVSNDLVCVCVSVCLSEYSQWEVPIN